LDVDGVLADFLTPALDIIERITGRKYISEEIVTWDIFEIVGKEWEQPFFEACSQPGFAASLAVYSGAQEGVRRLHEIAEVYIVTSPLNHNPTWTYERELWLKEHFGIPHGRIVHTSAKHLCVGDALIDDRPYNIQKWGYGHPAGTGILWDAPWNRRDRVPEVRTHDWQEVLSLVSHMGRE
jgi:5'(3')-deoxyribonucleotidase